jgi:hypothetical protein
MHTSIRKYRVSTQTPNHQVVYENKWSRQLGAKVRRVPQIR